MVRAVGLHLYEASTKSPPHKFKTVWAELSGMTNLAQNVCTRKRNVSPMTDKHLYVKTRYARSFINGPRHHQINIMRSGGLSNVTECYIEPQIMQHLLECPLLPEPCRPNDLAPNKRNMIGLLIWSEASNWLSTLITVFSAPSCCRSTDMSMLMFHIFIIATDVCVRQKAG